MTHDGSDIASRLDGCDAMKAARRHASSPRSGDHATGLILIGLVAALLGVLLWTVSVYGSALRDPRYFDGWVLAAVMSAQVWFHISRKSGLQSPRAAIRWRRFHIGAGYATIVIFASHSEWSVPDAALEWVLWLLFVGVVTSGIFGTYLDWFKKSRLGAEQRTNLDDIPARRAELARLVQAAVVTTDPAATAIPLPQAPYDDWILDLYTTRLAGFFEGRRNVASHLLGSQRPSQRLLVELDSLAPYLDRVGEGKLAYLRGLVVEKDQLDRASVYHDLTRGWLLVHVPATYSLVILTVLHIVVVHAFSSGAS